MISQVAGAPGGSLMMNVNAGGVYFVRRREPLPPRAGRESHSGRGNAYEGGDNSVMRVSAKSSTIGTFFNFWSAKLSSMNSSSLECAVLVSLERDSV